MTIYVRGQVILFVTAMENTHKLFFFFFFGYAVSDGESSRRHAEVRFDWTVQWSGIAMSRYQNVSTADNQELECLPTTPCSG